MNQSFWSPQFYAPAKAKSHLRFKRRKHFALRTNPKKGRWQRIDRPQPILQNRWGIFQGKPKPSRKPHRKSVRLLGLLALTGAMLVLIKTLNPYWPILWSPFPTTETEALSRAIINQESHANFRAVNPDSGALGYAQILPENLPAWSHEALGYEVTAQEFLADPKLQEKIIQHRINLYWHDALTESAGDKEQAVLRVASRWYSGDANLYTSTRSQSYNGQDYPSIAQYSQLILKKWQRQCQPWQLF